MADTMYNVYQMNMRYIDMLKPREKVDAVSIVNYVIEKGGLQL